MSTLHNAIMEDRIRQVELLLSVGINVNAQDELGRTPLMTACFMRNVKRRETVCDLLLQYNANVERLDKFNRNTIMYACATRNIHLLEKLLEFIDSDMNHADLDGITCLMYAAIEGDPRVLRIILSKLTQYGVSLDVRDNRGFTAYLLALKHGNIKCADILRKSGASVNVFDLENHWDAEQWIKTHYVQRLRRESLQVERQRQTKSAANRRRGEHEVKLTQRPLSIPPTFTFKTHGQKNDARSDKGWEKSDTRMDREREKGWIKAARGNVGSYKQSTGFQSDSGYPSRQSKSALSRQNEDTDSVTIYTNSSRPQTVSSLRSETLSLSVSTEYAATVSSNGPRRKQYDLQRKELIQIFQEYGIRHKPLPPARPKITAKRKKGVRGNKFRMTEEKRLDVSGLLPVAPNSPRQRGRKSIMLASKIRAVRTELKVLAAMKPGERE